MFQQMWKKTTELASDVRGNNLNTSMDTSTLACKILFCLPYLVLHLWMWVLTGVVQRKRWDGEIKVPFWQIEMLHSFTLFLCSSTLPMFSLFHVLWSAGSLSRHHSSSHSEGRCPWHWEEHCGCGAELQQLQVSLFFSSLLLKIHFIVFYFASIATCFVGTN